MLRGFATIALAAALLAAPAWAKGADDLRAAQDAARKGDSDLVIASVTHALQAGDLGASDQAAAYSLRGAFYGRKSRFDDAIADFTEVVRLKPGFADGYLERGAAYQGKGQTAQALVDYDNAIHAEADSAQAYNNRCYLLAQMGRTDEALNDCNKSLAFGPHNTAALDSRAYVFFKMGKYPEAITDYSEAVRLAPNFPAALYGLGAAKLKIGDATGNDNIAAAAKLNPNIADLMTRLGVKP